MSIASRGFYIRPGGVTGTSGGTTGATGPTGPSGSAGTKYPHIIAHRGLMDDTDPKLENHPDQLKKAIAEGFGVEIDVRIVDDKIFLGHDEPKYEVDVKFINNLEYIETENSGKYQSVQILIHCKNAEALIQKYRFYKPIFWHQEDDYTLTSGGHIITYPRANLTLGPNSIAIMPELVPGWANLEKCYGVVTDKPRYYKQLFEKLKLLE